MQDDIAILILLILSLLSDLGLPERGEVHVYHPSVRQ